MTITKKDKESKEPNTIKKVLKKHLKEEKRKMKDKVNKTRVFTDEQKWSKYIGDKREKAKQLKAVKNIGKFISSKKKKFEKEWKKHSGKTEDEGKIGKVYRADW